MTPPYRVALLQLRAYSIDDHQAAWSDLLRRVDQALEHEPDLLVLPAGAYPAGVVPSIEAYEAAGVLTEQEVIEALGARARGAGSLIAFGLVTRSDDGRLRHDGIVLSRNGIVAASAGEQHPGAWFAPGQGAVPVAAAARPALLVTGNDVRDPRTAAMIAETGSRLVIHCGASTTWGADRAQPAPSLDASILSARAAEGGAWLVTAGKTGIEAASVLYDGGAGVVDPSGEWVIRAPASGPGMVQYEIDLDAVPLAPVNAQPSPRIDEPIAASPVVRPVAAIAFDPPASAVDLVEELRRLVHAATAHGVRIAVVPDLAGYDTRAVSQLETLPVLQSLSEAAGIVLVVSLAERTPGATFKTTYVIDSGRIAGSQRQRHLVAGETAAGFTAGEAPHTPVETSIGTIGVIGAADGLVPGLGSALRAAGAGLIAWSAGHVDAPVDAIAQARALETVTPVIAGGGTMPRGGAIIARPDGTLAARSPAGEAMVVTAALPGVLADEVEVEPPHSAISAIIEATPAASVR